MRQQKTSAPDKPFFMYFAPGATHSPHHAPKDWIERFRGRFDQGWDALREETYQRQLAEGIIPEGTRIRRGRTHCRPGTSTPRRIVRSPPGSWRSMPGSLPTSIITWAGSSTPSRSWGPGTTRCSSTSWATMARRPRARCTEPGAARLTRTASRKTPSGSSSTSTDLGSAACENHYNAAWAWALDAPFQWTKQVASHFGGTRNALALSWPKGIAEAGGLRTQFHHVIDLAPTILEAAGIPHPASVNGVSQEPIEGTSMAYSFTDATAPSTHRTQYFEILANRGIYHEGWMASCFHGRVPWQRSQDLPIDGPQEHWELFDLASDFSQSVDLAFQHPDKLSELRGLFDAEARRYHVYPLSGETTSRALPFHRPSLIAGRRTFTYYPENVRMPEMAVVNMKNHDFDLVAHLEVPEGTVEGVVMCQGGNMAGWSLYVRDGRPIYHYNWLGHEQYVVESPRALPAGEVALRGAIRL